jgi:hypothetical protein
MNPHIEDIMEEMADTYSVPFLIWVMMDTKMVAIKEIVHLMSDADLVGLLRSVLWKQEKDLSVIGEYIKYDLLEEMTIRIIFEHQCKNVIDDDYIQKYLMYCEIMSE